VADSLTAGLVFVRPSRIGGAAYPVGLGELPAVVVAPGEGAAAHAGAYCRREVAHEFTDGGAFDSHHERHPGRS
jgi:hypothetical protein